MVDMGRDLSIKGNLTTGPVLSTMLRFAFPLMAGNLLQQCYNIADTVIVGRTIGADALAAVGSAYSLMTFLTSVFIGLCMGSGVVYSHNYGSGDEKGLRESISVSFVLILSVTLIINLLVVILADWILSALRVPQSVLPLMDSYLDVIYTGLIAVFIYNFFAALLRALGNSVVPLVFLAVSAILNIILDLVLILSFGMGVKGAATATVISQYASALGIAVYAVMKLPQLRDFCFSFTTATLKKIADMSFLTSLQQSVMNLGILMIQGLVNSFGPAVMAAFAAAVKIDSFAYMPAQEFGNAFSTFIAQNHGAGKRDRIGEGIRKAVLCTVVFCLAVTFIIVFTAPYLMQIFIDSSEEEIISIGSGYLRIEGAFYFGIGILFLLYGLYRALGRPGMSLVLTIISLGLRVALAYAFSPLFGVDAIWWAIPIGWVSADLAGMLYYRLRKPVLNG